MIRKYATSSLGRFRVIAFLEGISFLILMFVAMPLKYFADMPFAVRITGSLHGLFFVLYVLLLIQVALTYKWSVLRSFSGFIASVLPFGTFVFDNKVVRAAHEEELNS